MNKTLSFLFHLPKRILFIGLFLSGFAAYSQQDSIRLTKYTSGFRFKDGIYISHSQLLNNNPIPVKHIITKYKKTDFDFFSKLLSEKKISYFDQYGMKKEIDVDNLWGFCRRGSIYINWGDDFCRIPVVGTVCHFIASITVYENNYYNPSYGFSTYSMPTTTTRTEIFQFMMDFETGKVIEYTEENILVFLMADQELYDEFNALSKKKQKQMKFLYLRKFNEKHPLYVPID